MGLGYFDADDDYHHCADGTVPTTVVLAIALDMMAVVAWISGRLERRPEYAR